MQGVILAHPPSDWFKDPWECANVGEWASLEKASNYRWGAAQRRLILCRVTTPVAFHLLLYLFLSWLYAIHYLLCFLASCVTKWLFTPQAGLMGDCILKVVLGKRAGRAAFVSKRWAETFYREKNFKGSESLRYRYCRWQSTKPGMKCFNSCFRPNLSSEPESVLFSGMEGKNPRDSHYATAVHIVIFNLDSFFSMIPHFVSNYLRKWLFYWLPHHLCTFLAGQPSSTPEQAPLLSRVVVPPSKPGELHLHSIDCSSSGPLELSFHLWTLACMYLLLNNFTCSSPTGCAEGSAPALMSGDEAASQDSRSGAVSVQVVHIEIRNVTVFDPDFAQTLLE